MTMQPALLVFPDAELWATTFLRTLDLDGTVWIGNRVPNPRHDLMVVVRRDGGAAAGVFDHPRLSVRCWSTTESDVADLASLVGAYLRAAAGTGPCTNVVQLTGPTPIADESDQPLRYQLFELDMRGTVPPP